MSLILVPSLAQATTIGAADLVIISQGGVATAATQAQLISPQQSSGLTAGTAGAPYPISGQNILFATVAAGGTAQLPAGASQDINIVNNGANDLTILLPSGCTLVGSGASAWVIPTGYNGWATFKPFSSTLIAVNMPVDQSVSST